jgi:hypothetical protein
MAKSKNPWMIHLAKFRKEHPEFKGVQAAIHARKTYHKTR